MAILKSILVQYWPQCLAVLLFVPAVWIYIALGQWETQIGSIAIATFGFISMAFPDEVASCTGGYGWTRRSYWTSPPAYIRLVGFAMQVGVLIFGFR